jgi:hypothetical protein
LRHPELPDAPATMAEMVGYWQENGRYIGLRLQFQGEHHERCLTYAEIAKLQETAV